MLLLLGVPLIVLFLLLLFILSSGLTVKLPLKFPVKDSLLQFPPKNEHNTKPNNNIKNRNNASVFIV